MTEVNFELCQQSDFPKHFATSKDQIATKKIFYNDEHFVFQNEITMILFGLFDHFCTSETMCMMSPLLKGSPASLQGIYLQKREIPLVQFGSFKSVSDRVADPCHLKWIRIRRFFLTVLRSLNLKKTVKIKIIGKFFALVQFLPQIFHYLPLPPFKVIFSSSKV